MGVTISTHNGSAVHREHNVRNPKVADKLDHIDDSGRYEIWNDEKIKNAYERLFGESVREYNEKQKRKDRKIKSYYKDVQADDKKHLAYEMIIGIYSKNQQKEDGTPVCDHETGKEIMRQFVNDWQKRNPNLELIGAYYHGDEPGAEPHVHIDYIPVAHGYTHGPETQTGLVKALGEQGFEKEGKYTAQIQWEARENKYLESLCRERGLEVEHPKQEKVKHLHTEIYKQQKNLDNIIDNVKEQKQTLENVENNILEAEGKLSFTEQKIDSREQIYNDLIRKADEVRDYLDSTEERILEARERVQGADMQAEQAEKRAAEATQNADKAEDRMDHIQHQINDMSRTVENLKRQAQEEQHKIDKSRGMQDLYRRVNEIVNMDVESKKILGGTKTNLDPEQLDLAVRCMRALPDNAAKAYSMTREEQQRIYREGYDKAKENFEPERRRFESILGKVRNENADLRGQLQSYRIQDRILEERLNPNALKELREQTQQELKNIREHSREH